MHALHRMRINHQRSGRFKRRSKRLPRLAEYLPKATSEEVMIGLYTLLKRDIQLSKHDRNETASTCAGNEVDMTRSHTVTSSDHVFHIILSHLILESKVMNGRKDRLHKHGGVSS